MLWGLGRVEPRATYGIAVDKLKRQIHSGLLLPDEKLPAERQLSDEFGISRVTLREALRVLETDNYIIVRRGVQGGAFVTDEDRLNELSQRMLARAPGNASRVLEFLCVNEVAAARFAVQRRTPPELKRMAEATDLLKAARHGPELRQAETYFRLALGDASHNDMMAQAIGDALAELFLTGANEPFEGRQRVQLARFVQLSDAIKSHDLNKALSTLAELHEDAWDRLRSLTRSAA